MYFRTGQPTFNNANGPNVTLIVSNLSPSTLVFLNSSGIEVVNNMTNVSGELVCRADGSIREDFASRRPALIGSETDGAFVNGSAQCGDCGKLYEMIKIFSLNVVSILLLHAHV